VNYNKH